MSSVAYDVGDEDPRAAKLLEQVEEDVRFPLLADLADGGQVVGQTHRTHLVAHLPKRDDYVVFGLPLPDFLVGVALERVGGDQLFVDQDGDAERLHSAIL